MRSSSRLATAAGIALLALGLAACGDSTDDASDTPSSPPASSAPADEPSGPAGDPPGQGDFSALVGDWELVPDEPHSKTPLTFAADGTVESPASDGAMATRGFTGTVSGDEKGYVVQLTSTDDEKMQWMLILSPGDSADSFDVVDEKMLTYKLNRL